MYYSKRKKPLVYCGDTDIKRPILTVENNSDWNSLYLVKPDGTVKEYWPPDKLINEFRKDYPNKLDLFAENHCFNPEMIPYIAQKEKFILCNQSFYMIAGRWEVEQIGNYID